MLPYNAKMTLNKKGHPELVIKRKGKPTEHTLNELDEITVDLVEEIMTPLPNPSAEYAISSEMPTEYRDANRPPYNDLDPFEMDPIIVGNDIGTACDRAEHNDQTRSSNDDLNNWAPGSGGETEVNPLEGKSLEQQKDNITASNYYTAKFVDKNTNNPVLTDRDLDPDYATSECVSSTAGIATGVMNSFFHPTGRGKMKSRRRLMREFTPDFEPGNYKPGKAEMNKPKGEGLADKTPIRLGYEADSEMHEVGEPLGMKRKHNVAMGQATDGAELEAPHHESKHGDPLEGSGDYPDIQYTEVGHNWPAAPKNKGGSNEEYPGSRWTDGGTLTGGHVKSGEMASEGWSPEKIGTLIEGVDENIVRHLFNNWVKGIRQVRLSEFEDLLHANGIEFAMNESAFENLLAAHDRILFHEGHDADGKYWIGENAEMPEFIKKKIAKSEHDEEGEEDECESGSGHCGLNEEAHFNVAKKKYMTDEGGGATNLGEVAAETEMEDHGQIDSLLRGEPENKNDETPIVPGTGVGMHVKQVQGNGAVAVKSLEENVQRLSSHVAPHLLRAEKRISGPFTASYFVLECKMNKNRKGKRRKNLAEALVDAEENIQYGSAKDNFLIAQYRRPNGAVLFQQTIPLLTINSRTPVMAEGKALFRSAANATRFMAVLKEHKVSSCVDRHPYGYAVWNTNGRTIKEMNYVGSGFDRKTNAGTHVDTDYADWKEMVGKGCSNPEVLLWDGFDQAAHEAWEMGLDVEEGIENVTMRFNKHNEI